MVVSIDSLKKAIVSYMETEIMPKLSSSSRLPFGACILIAPKFIDMKYKELQPFVQAMEIGTADGSIDIDRAESTVCELMNKYGTYTKDLLGIHLCLDQSDIHRLAEIARVM